MTEETAFTEEEKENQIEMLINTLHSLMKEKQEHSKWKEKLKTISFKINLEIINVGSIKFILDNGVYSVEKGKLPQGEAILQIRATFENYFLFSSRQISNFSAIFLRNLKIKGKRHLLTLLKVGNVLRIIPNPNLRINTLLTDMTQFRDRDAPITKEGIIFRTYGYTHPLNACFCDVEYAPASIYSTSDPRAIRSDPEGLYYKFYFDGGLQFIKKKYPQYQISHKALQKKLVGVDQSQSVQIRRPDESLRTILQNPPDNKLIDTLLEVLDFVTDHSQLRPHHFGVFGSICHNFYHVDYSDIDLIIYGRKALKELRETLLDFYQQPSFPIQNEFTGWNYQRPTKHWYFKHYSIQEYPFYELRKLIYAVIRSKAINRPIKIEFEPVKNWSEIQNEYPNQVRIERTGWIKAIAQVFDDRDAFNMESIYKIEILKILEGPKIDDIIRILSFVEEFRGQVQKDEEILVEGNIERVILRNQEFHQITLSYGPRYYDQTLKLSEK
ncbi:MAG: hypothetical protein HWN66_19300 [Candidatus Helarchaeota archaeon]|nr:hypothetical protein [Candidatus Helarchaeota archaeon]